ncbi:MAG: AAA family ATPase [Gammaproteobacteria bacterium]
MYRNLEQYLQNWRKQVAPIPLIIRGARQVGKSYLVEKFGKEYFTNIVVVNFEYSPEFIGCFKTMDPNKIVHAISVLSGAQINPQQTLLFLDEIQECPNAIKALRYFKEKMPNLHVVGAGSLLEFVLNDEKISIPVGRVQFMHLKPLSFQEFLLATNNEKLNQYIKNVSVNDNFPEVFHKKLLTLLHEYTVLGGMPAVIQDYITENNFGNCQNIQANILNGYKNDFGKYTTKANHKYLQKLFAKAPGIVGQQFKYVKIDPEMRSRDLKIALENLCYAGLINMVYATSASGLPFGISVNEKKFKILFLDIGLVKRATNLEAEILLQQDLLLINRGSLAEQFVGQELLAYSSPLMDAELFYWMREKRGSIAEVDFVIQVNANIVPIEVKAGSTGSLKSMKRFMQEKKLPFGVRISQQELKLVDNILSVPFYMVSEITRLINQLIPAAR